tara:strand:+ start:97 stop:279 length:183 start_codon:yes stop_codon:yes gene_type:complete
MNDIELTTEAVEDFKSYLLAVFTQDIYSQLKGYLSDYDNYSEAIEYFINNLTADLEWNEP